ncbi:MAG: efflux RND transporter periplasmic adaptor subunit, partial [Verrucomicrobiia bacterium]
AVLRTGRRAVVYVALPDRDRPTFEGREIVLGPKAGQVYIVRSGLTEGERVVTHGAFKIDSALQILAKPSMMNPEGGGPVPGHNHGGVTATVTTPAGGSGSDSLMLAPDLAAQVMPAYFDLHAALAADNLPAAREALSAMMQVTGHQGALPDLIHPLLAADDLDNIRRPHFETISNALIAAVRADPTAFTGDVVLMHCPMVYEDRGADWLQSDETLLNPYFGAMMLTCGNMRENLTATDESDHSGHAH